MKKAIASLCLVSLGLAGGLRIGVNPRFGVQNAYGLSCEGAVGQVKYYVEGLPNGVTFENEAIVISNWAVAGNYTVKIRAVDSNGNSAEKVISLTINSQTSTGGVAGSAGGVAGGAGGVAGGAGGVAGGAGGAPGAGGAGGAPGGSGGAPGGGAPGGGAPGGGAPGGGAPGGGAPGGGAPGGGAPGRLDSILGNYGGSGVPSTPNWGNTGRYPEPNFPTGGSPGLNPTTIRIGGDQAQPTPANRNPITPDDVALRAASERHQNAIKGITNLLKIIDQAKANKDKAQSDIQTYTQAYNDAVSAQRAAQNDIIAAETRTSQITSAINSLTTTIDDLRNKIAQAGTARDGYTREKTTITATITGLEGTKAGLLEKLKGIDNEVGQRVKELSDKNSECQSLADAVNRKTNELTNAQNEYAGLETTRNTLSIDITRKSGIVDDLRRQLQQAEKDLADAKIRLSDLDARRLALPVQISTLKGELDELQRRAKACADEVTRIQNIINGLKTGDYNGLTNQIKDLDGKISAQRTRVTEIDAQLASSQGPLEDLKAKLASATEDLSFVRTQKNDADGNLRIAYQRGNDSNNRVAFAKQNIDAVIKRFQDESKIVSDATMNLERARAEEALARLGLEELIAHYTNALPYAIVPNGNGATNPGTPFGNNPSGSPLGPINANGNGAPGSFRVNSWTNYLSTAYGAGVNPSFPGSVTELFPFNFLSGTSGNQGSGTTVTNAYGNIRGGFTGGAGGAGGAGSAGGCGGAIPTGQTPVVTTGIVVAVRGDSFDVKSDNNGQVYTVGVSPCSQLNANRPDYIMETGHTAVVKGYQTQQYKIEASQATCLKQ